MKAQCYQYFCAEHRGSETVKAKVVKSKKTAALPSIAPFGWKIDVGDKILVDIESHGWVDATVLRRPVVL
jgi:hypothetical protein